jgi:zinc transport system permease protein
MLISSLIIFPALTAMRVCRRFITVVLGAAAISVCCFLAGLLLSYAFSTPSGASVVAVNLLVFLLFSGIGYMKERA